MKMMGWIWILMAGGLWAQTRVITHVTRADGGFNTRFQIVNEEAGPTEAVLRPYTAAGDGQDAVTLSVEGQSVLSMSKADLFGETDVSHVVIEGDVVVTAAYASVAGGSPAHVAESDVVAKRFRLFAGDWARVFDGVAVVNVGETSEAVWIDHKDARGVTRKTHKLADVAAMAKALFVIGGPGVNVFDAPQDGDWFEIYAAQPLMITALRGDLPGNNYLWQNQATISRPAVVKVTNDQPGSSACVDPRAMNADSPDLNNQPQGEVWIDVSPTGTLATCAKDNRFSPTTNTLYNNFIWCGLYLSDDGGDSWRNRSFADRTPYQGLDAAPDPGYSVGRDTVIRFDHMTDPVVAFDGAGNLFTGALAYRNNDSMLTLGKRSPDGVLTTWHNIAVENDTTLFNDKNWLVVDRTLPADQATVIVTWRLFTNSQQPSQTQGGWLVVSGDGGQTVSDPIRMPIPAADTANSQFYQPIIGLDPATGRQTFFVTFRSFDDPQNMTLNVAKVPVDIQGTSALAQRLRTASNWTYLDRRIQTPAYGSNGVNGAFRFSTYFFPALTDDGSLWVAYNSFVPETGGVAVSLMRSRDGGANWTDPIQIDYPGQGFQLMPTIAASGDQVSVLWYDSRHDEQFTPQGLIHKLDVYYAEIGTDLVVRRVLRLTPESQVADHPVFTRPGISGKQPGPHEFYPHDVGSGMWPLFDDQTLNTKLDIGECDGYGFIGDYIGVATNDTHAYAVWTDLRDLTRDQNICEGNNCGGRRNQNVYFARIKLPKE